MNPKGDTFNNWLIFTVAPRYLAVGANLVGVRLSQQLPSLFGRTQIEKLELHVRYRIERIDAQIASKSAHKLKGGPHDSIRRYEGRNSQLPL